MPGIRRGLSPVLALPAGPPSSWPADPWVPVVPELCIACRRRSGIARRTPLRSIVCGPCWSAGDDHTVGPAGAAPQTLLPRTAPEWFRAVIGSAWFQCRRRDAAARLRGLMAELATRADWDDHTTWPTWDRLQTASTWRRSSTAAWLAELQRQGWLVRLERGTTPRFRPMALQHLGGNRAAVYQLRVPAEEAERRALPVRPEETEEDTTWTPTTPPRLTSVVDQVVPSRARTIIHSDQPSSPGQRGRGPTGPSQEEPSAGRFAERVPVTGAEMLAAAAELRGSDRALARLTPRWVRALMRPWWREGWTNDDLRIALDHRPDPGGRVVEVLRCPAERLRWPDGWVRHRLRAWRDDRGPLVAPSVHARRRQETRNEHGAAAGGRLRYGTPRVEPADLHVTGEDRAAATEQIVRGWARDFHERRNRPRPDHEVADPRSARRHLDEIARALGATRGPLAAPAPRQNDSSPGNAPQDARERALARARAERRGDLGQPGRRWRRSR